MDILSYVLGLQAGKNAGGGGSSGGTDIIAFSLCKYFKIPTEQLFISDDLYLQKDINITSLLVDKIVEYEN